MSAPKLQTIQRALTGVLPVVAENERKLDQFAERVQNAETQSEDFSGGRSYAGGKAAESVDKYGTAAAAEEFTGGAVVGGILGGAQTAIGSIGKGVFMPGSGLDTPVQTKQTTQSGTTAPTQPVTDTNVMNQPQDTTAQNAAPGSVQTQKNTAPTGKAALPKMTMADFADANSPVWNNVGYNDAETQSAIMRTTHQEMVNAGDVVQIPSDTIKQVEQSYPDLRSMKKSERTPILRQKINELKTSLRKFLNELKGGSYEFEVNGNILEAKLYDTGIREVMEKITQDKASMLYHSDQVFQNARYLYSTPDYDGDPNIYRWNYFYTPVQIGEETVGVRIAVRDMVEGTNNLPESQIYNWGIKTDATLGGGRPGVSAPSSGASSVAPSDPSIRQSAQGVNAQDAQTSGGVFTPGGILSVEELQKELEAARKQRALDELNAAYERNVDGLGKAEGERAGEIFQAAGEYIGPDGTFDLETAKTDYRDFLQNAPEKNKLYLQQSLETVTYEQRKLKRSPFGYDSGMDTIAYDPKHPAFKSLNFQIALTHELAHRIDEMFVWSWEDDRFAKAISDAKDVIAADPERFIAYCAENDVDGFLSDIISAICEDDYRLEFYHDKTYWKIAGSKEREIFANLFSLEAFGDPEKIKFIAAHFPEILKVYDEFISIL